MTKLRLITDALGKPQAIHTDFRGRKLLNTAALNKGTAFTREERDRLSLSGLLPASEETLSEQSKRLYKQYQRQSDDLQKNVFLRRLHDENMVLFYRLVCDHLAEMLPIVYTPTVGKAVLGFSHQFSHPRGIYMAYPDRHRIEQIFANYAERDIRLIVLSDGEGVLGIGDQGIGGMEICMAKIVVYTMCGGMNPYFTLPLQLDVGTNNPDLLRDPTYLGWRHPRIQENEYHAFVDTVIQTIRRQFPSVFLHWEDFGRDHAQQLLTHYQDQLCSFNDDIQGTGAVTSAAILSALKITKQSFSDQRIMIFGGGSAGIGIADQLCDLMVHTGLTPEQAREQFWVIDRAGVITESNAMNEAQRSFARPSHEAWDASGNVESFIERIHPTILIGCSACTGAFTQAAVERMSQFTERPIILPLSNPPERSEATPEGLMMASQGRALIATGSPFPPVTHQGKSQVIAQCNNALIYPGIGLGCIIAKACQVTPNLLAHACEALANVAHEWHQNHPGEILPPLSQAPAVSQRVALAVAQAAIQEGVSLLPSEQHSQIHDMIQAQYWEPHYLPLHSNDVERGH